MFTMPKFTIVLYGAQFNIIIFPIYFIFLAKISIHTLVRKGK